MDCEGMGRSSVVDTVLSVRLTAHELAWVEACWDQERYARADGAPRLVNQQYVLFDEFETWPNSEGWP